MAANKFLTEIDLEFNGNFDDIAAQAQAALRKISETATTETQAGRGTTGLGPAVQEVGRRVAQGAAAGNFNPQQLRDLQKIFTDFGSTIKSIVPRFTGATPDINRNVQSARTQPRVAERAEQNRLAALVRDETERRRQNAANNRALNNPTTNAAVVQDETQANELKAALDQARAGSQEYAESVVKAATQANELAANISEAKAGSAEYNSSLVAAATAAKAEAAAADEALANNQAYLEATGLAAVTAKKLAASEELAAQANTGYADAIRASITAQKERQAVEAEVTASQENVLAAARQQVAQQRFKTNVAAEVNRQTNNPEDIRSQAAANAASASQKAQVELATLQAKDINVEAALIVEKQRYSQELAKAVDQLKGQSPTLFQAIQHAFNPSGNGAGSGGGGSATGERTLGQFFGSHVTRTLGYAVPGIAIGIGFTELEKTIKESEQAQRSFALLNSEFETLGQNSQLQGFTTQIQHLSESTGVAVNEVAQLGLIMKGVFQDTNQAEIALTGVTQAAIAFGLSATEAGQDTVAITQAFSDLSSQGGKSTTSLANEVANAQNQFGVPAGQILTGEAAFAPAAAQLGLNSNQSVALLAGTAQRSGIPAEEVGQNLSRILPQFTATLPDLLRLYQNIPQLQPSNGKFLGDITSGNTGGAFLQFISDFKNIPRGIQQSIAEQLGDTRYAPQLIAASQNAAEINRVGNGPVPQDAAANAYKQAQKTLQVQLDQVRNDFINAGEGILNSGVGRAIADAVGGLGEAAKAFASINGALHGGLGDGLLAIAGGFIALRTAMAITKSISGLADWLGTLSGTSKTTTVQIAGQSAANTELGTTAVTTTAELDTEATTNAVVGGSRFGGAGGALGAVAAVPAGIAIGNFLRDEGKKNSLVGAAISPITEPAKLLGSLFGGTHGTQRFSSKEQAQVDAFLSGNGAELSSITNLLSPSQLAQFQKDLAASREQTTNFGGIKQTTEGSVSAYNQALNIYNAAGQTKQGHTDIVAAQKEQAKQQQAVTDKLDRLSGINPQQIDALQQTNTAQEQAAAAAAAAAEAKKEQAIIAADIAAGASNELNTYQDLESYYEAGQVGFGKYVAALKQQIQSLAIVAASPGANQQTAVDQLAQAQAALAQAQDQQAQQVQQVQQSTKQQGLPTTDISNLKSLATLVGKEKNPSDIISTGTSAIQSIYQYISDSSAAAQNGAQKIAASTQTVAIPQSVIDAFAKLGITIPSSITGVITATQRFQDLNEDIQSAGQLAQANAHEDPLKQAQAALNTANQQLQAVIQSGEGPTSTDYIQAKAAQAQAAQQVVDQQNAIASAQTTLVKSYDTASGNVLAQAQDDLQLANEAVQAAHGTAAKLQAEAQQVAANREIVTAINSIATAQVGLVTAMANATGDPNQIIAAAENAAAVDLANANRIKAADLALGKNPNQDQAFVQALTQYYNDRATAANTIAQQTIDSNETLLFLGKETASQAIANLEAALPKVKGDIAATNQILTEIRQIQNAAGSNLDFNIPTSLLINPTLYQAARVSQSGNGAYQDNRQVQVTVNVNNASNNKGAVNQILAAIGGRATSGASTPVVSGPLATPGA